MITKGIFNLCVDVKMPLDKWSIIDFFCSISNIVCFNVIGSIEPDQVIDVARKQRLDYYVIAVVVVSWLRFFAYFLMIRQISKLIMTLYRMLIDTISFIFIVCCYLLITSTIFTMLFQDTDMSESYGSLSMSYRTLFTALTGAYAYSTDPSFETSNSILTMVHVFISNIFMLNYLVAILSTVYEIMKDEGEFSFKANKYQFIEKYSVAMLDPNGYSELIIHPPPLNVFTLFILPCIIKKSLMKKAADVFSKLIFWCENVLYLMVFLSYELMLCPLIYFKLMISVIRFSSWK